MMRDFFSKLLIPTLDTVYDYYLDERRAVFVHWKERKEQMEFRYQKELSFFQLFVPTVDTERTQDLLKKLIAVNKPVFLTGSTGTGKSVIVQQFIRTQRENMELTPIVLNFSAQTTSKSTQLNIEAKLFKKR
jgi:dynein heavy chain, axonemal